QKLHADPGAKRKARDPAGARFGVDGLRPVERGSRIRQFAGAVIERALAAADAAEIEAQHRKSAMRERIVTLVDDLVIHRAVKLRMRVQHHRDRRVLLLRRMITAFEAACGAGKNDFGHWWSLANQPTCAGSSGCHRRGDLAALGGARTAPGELWRGSSMSGGAKSKGFVGRREL